MSELLAENQPGPALPLLHLSMLGRKYNQPPVEEFLIAEALLALNKPDEAKRYYRAAIEWLDKAQVPKRMTNAVAAPLRKASASRLNLAEFGDPRYNEFDWESWHECDVFQARVEKTQKRK